MHLPRPLLPRADGRLEGDHGGSAVIRRHEDALALFEVSPDELRDVDTPMALAALRGTLA